MNKTNCGWQTVVFFFLSLFLSGVLQESVFTSVTKHIKFHSFQRFIFVLPEYLVVAKGHVSETENGNGWVKELGIYMGIYSQPKKELAVFNKYGQLTTN